MNSKTTAPFNKSSQNNTNPQHKSTKPCIDNKQNKNKNKKRRRRNRKRNKNKASSQKNKPSKLLSIDSKPNQCPQSNISEHMLQQTTSKQIDEVITTKNGKLPAPKIIDHDHNYIVMEETPEMYKKVTFPFIMKYKDHKSSEWIHKCSNHTKENEKQNKLYGDEYFIAYIQPNWIKEKKHCDPLKYPDPNKWGKHKQTDPRHLRIMAIVNTKKYNKLRTLRDIRGDLHYKLLSHIKITLCRQIKIIYGVNEDKLKIYLHYRPTALLLHIHFVHENNYNQHIQHHRDHFIDVILKHIESEPNYYKHTTLPHQIYFDRQKTIIFAQDTKRLMNMEGVHPWYDKKMLSETTKRPINRNEAIIMDNDEEWTDDGKTNNTLSNDVECKTEDKFMARKCNPITMKDDKKGKFKANKSKPITEDTDNNSSNKTKHRFPTNNHRGNYQRNNYGYNKYENNNNQYNDDSKWSIIR